MTEVKIDSNTPDNDRSATSLETLQEDIDLDNVKLDLDKILVEEEAPGFFTFTTETQEEGRKIGYEIGTSVYKQQAGEGYEEGSEASLLNGLRERGIIDDYRIDGNQLSFSEREDQEGKVWVSSIFQRYGSDSPKELDKLNRAVEGLGFSTIQK